MEVEILQENLQKGLSSVSRFVASKASLPVLSMILIQVKNGEVEFSATNMDTAIQMAVGAKVVSEGGVVVPAKLLMEYVGLLHAGNVKLRVKDNVLELSSSGKRAKITGVDVSEFPAISNMSQGEKVVFSVSDLERIVKLVTFSASSDETRPVLSAILLEFNNDSVRVVATDGYRLSLLDKIKVEGGVEKGKVLISARVFEEMVRLVKDEGAGKVEMMVGNEQKSLVFMLGNVRLTTRLIDGDYPSYEKIIPKEGDVVWSGLRTDLLESVKAAAIFARESSNIVKWELSGEELTMKANSSGVGEQESLVLVKLDKGESGKIAFNSRFLVELLNNVGEEEIVFSMTGPLSPGLFKAGKNGFLHVIMPVRVQGE